MRLALPFGLAVMLGAAPAYATGTVHCRSADRAGLEIYLVIGYGAGPMIAQARIVKGNEEIATGDAQPSPRIAQSWLDDRELRLDITDWNLEAFVARLRASRRTSRGPYVGTLQYRGRSMRLTCTSEDS